MRVRVERALEKMRASLARHGVVSTTAALSSALAHEGGVIAPAGFAASVTGVALAGAAATDGGIAAGLVLSTFMSTTKLGAWSVTAVVLCASLGGNAYLLTQSTRADESPPAHPRSASASPAAGTALAHAKSADLAAMRDELRAAGASEAPSGFNALGDGRYAPHRTAVSSNTWFAATPISVTTPPRTPIQPVPLPRRGGN